mmetsp:Transcript_34139/g.47324  ORF Transcript_34139/g.47324 Transcript_34139/m.47324 type:complete len:129 (+) Transcript_34139:363-749(+)
MGKWVVLPQHPENYFFESFYNTLIYSTPDEFVTCINHAKANTPAPLTTSERHSLTWEAATERFLDVAQISEDEWPRSRKRDAIIAFGVLTCLRTGMPIAALFGGVVRIFIPGKSNTIFQLWNKMRNTF